MARRAAEEAADAAALREALVAAVSAQLGETLDAEEAVGRLAQLVVPLLADFCVVTLVEDDGGQRSLPVARDVGWWHADPARRADLDEYAQRRLIDLAPSSPLMLVLHHGRPVTVPTGAAAHLTEVLGDARARELITRLDPGSMTVLPLRGRDRTVGLLTIFGAPGRRPAGADELATAREIAVRYAPAVEAAHVGGDWYDAFVLPDGATTVVIGDVVGHDTAAAAAMGQLRALLRGVAADSGAGPAEVLARTDRVVAALGVDTTATSVVGRVERDGGRPLARFTWSNAGHPPPVLLRPDGSTALLGADDHDLMLGIDASTPRCADSVDLAAGSVVLLYSDGLVERRGRSIDEGLERLRSAMSDLAGRGLEELCDELLGRVLPGRPDDDVALIAVRVLP